MGDSGNAFFIRRSTLAGQRVHYQVVLDYAMHVTNKQNVLKDIAKPLAMYQNALAEVSNTLQSTFKYARSPMLFGDIKRMSKDLVDVRSTLTQVSKLVNTLGGKSGFASGGIKNEVGLILSQVKKGLSTLNINTASRYGSRLGSSTLNLSGTVDRLQREIEGAVSAKAQNYIGSMVRSLSIDKLVKNAGQASDWYKTVTGSNPLAKTDPGAMTSLIESARTGKGSSADVQKFVKSYVASINLQIKRAIDDYGNELYKDMRSTGVGQADARIASSSMVQQYHTYRKQMLNRFAESITDDLTTFAKTSLPKLTKDLFGETKLTEEGVDQIYQNVATQIGKIMGKFKLDKSGKGAYDTAGGIRRVFETQEEFLKSYNDMVGASFQRTIDSYSSLIGASGYLEMSKRGDISKLDDVSKVFAKSKNFNTKFESIVSPIKNIFSTVDSLSTFFLDNAAVIGDNPDIVKNVLKTQFQESLRIIGNYAKGGGVGSGKIQKDILPILRQYIQDVFGKVDRAIVSGLLKQQGGMEQFLASIQPMRSLEGLDYKGTFRGIFGDTFDPESPSVLPTVTEIAKIKQTFGGVGKDSLFTKFGSFFEFLTNPYWLEVKEALERANFRLTDESLVDLLKDPRFREHGRKLLPSSMNPDVDEKTPVGRQFLSSQKWAQTGLRLQAFGGKLSDEVLSIQQRASARYKIDQITALRFTQAYVMSTAAIRSMVVVMDTFFTKAIEMNKQVETMRLSFGALVSSVYEINEAGFPLSGADKFNASLQISTNIMRDFQLYAANTAVTFEELVEAFNAVIGLAGSKGVGLDDVAKYVKLGTVAVKSLGLTDQQVKQELRAMMSGRVRPAVDTLAASLNISGPDLKRWQEAGTLILNLTKKFEMFTYANEGYVNTFTGAFERMQQSVAYALSPVYDAVLEQLKITFNSITNYFVKEVVDENGNLIRMAINRDAIAPFKQLADAVATFIRYISEFSGTFKTLLTVGLNLLKGYLAFRVIKGSVTGLANFSRIIKDATLGVAKFVSTFASTMALLQSGGTIRKAWTSAGAAGAAVFPSTPWDKSAQFVGGSAGKILDPSTNKPASLLIGGQAGGATASSALGKALLAGTTVLAIVGTIASIASDFFRFSKEARKYTEDASKVLLKSGDYLKSVDRKIVRGMTRYMLAIDAASIVGTTMGSATPISQQDLTNVAAMMQTEKGRGQLGYYGTALKGGIEEQFDISTGIFAMGKRGFEELNLMREKSQSGVWRGMLAVTQVFVSFYGVIEKTLGWVVDLFGFNTRKLEATGVSPALLVAVKKARQLDVITKLPKLYADLMKDMLTSMFDSVADIVKQSLEMSTEKLSVSFAKEYVSQAFSGKMTFDNAKASSDFAKTVDTMFIDLVSGRFNTFKTGMDKVREWYESNDQAKQAFFDFEEAYSSIVSGDSTKVDKESKAAFENIRQFLISGGLPAELSSATGVIKSSVSSFADSVFDMFKTAIDAVKEVQDKVLEYKFGEQELGIYRQIKEAEQSMESLNKLEYLKEIAPQLRSSLGSISGAVSDLSKRAAQLQTYSKSEAELMSGESDLGIRAGTLLKGVFKNLSTAPDNYLAKGTDIAESLMKLTSVLVHQGVLGNAVGQEVFGDNTGNTDMDIALRNYKRRRRVPGNVTDEYDRAFVKRLAGYLSYQDFNIPTEKIGQLGMLFKGSAGVSESGQLQPSAIGYQALEGLGAIPGVMDEAAFRELTKEYEKRNQQKDAVKKIENSLNVLKDITIPGLESVGSTASAMWDQLKGIDATDIPADQLVAMMNVDQLREFVTSTQVAIEQLITTAGEQDTTDAMDKLKGQRSMLDKLVASAKEADMKSLDKTIFDLVNDIAGFVPGTMKKMIEFNRIMGRTEVSRSVMESGRLTGMSADAQQKTIERMEILASVNDIYGEASSAIDNFISSISQQGTRDFDPVAFKDIKTKKDEYTKLLKSYVGTLAELGTDPSVVKAVKKFLASANRREELAKSIKEFDDFKKGMDALSGFVGAEYLSRGKKDQVANVYANLLGTYRDMYLDREIEDMGIQDAGLRSMVKGLRIEQINDEIMRTLSDGLHSLYLSLYNAFDEFVESLSGAIASTLEDGLTSLLTGNFEDLKSFRENFTKSIASAISSFITEAIREAYIQPALESALSPLKSWLKSNVPQVMSNAGSGGAQGELVTGVRDTAKGVDSLVKAQKTSTSSQMSVMKQASSPASQSKLSGALSGAFKFATITNLIPNLLSSFRTTDYNLGAYTQPSELLSMAESEKQWNTSNMMYGIMNSAFGALKYGKGLYDSLKFSSQLDSWLNPYNQVQATKNLVGGWSTGGYISVGAGNKDDVPALLQKGEYVVSKNAVDRYGKAFFEDLNVRRYASGGSVGFDPMSFASSTFSSLAPIGGYFGAAKLFGSEAAGMAGGFGAAVGGIAGSLLAGMRNNKILKSYMHAVERLSRYNYEDRATGPSMYIPSYLKTSDTSYMDEPFNADSYDTLRRYQKQYGGSSLVDTVEDQVNENKAQTQVTVNNILDPNLFDDYIRSAKGQDAILNVIKKVR